MTVWFESKKRKGDKSKRPLKNFGFSALKTTVAHPDYASVRRAIEYKMKFTLIEHCRISVRFELTFHGTEKALLIWHPIRRNVTKIRCVMVKKKF